MYVLIQFILTLLSIMHLNGEQFTSNYVVNWLVSGFEIIYFVVWDFQWHLYSPIYTLFHIIIIISSNIIIIWGLPWCLRQWKTCLQLVRPRFNPWVRKTSGGGNGNPLQYACLENPMDREAWLGVAKNWTRLND